MKTRVLFVCHGNVCRSPIAEFVFKDMIERRGLIDLFEISSAATSTEEIWNGKGNPIYPPAQAELNRRGIGKTAYTDFSRKRARQVTRRDYEYYDYLLCADTANIRNTQRITGPDVDEKIRLLLDYDVKDIYPGMEIVNRGISISDPWYTGDFRTCYNDIERGLEGFIKYLGY